MSAQIIEINSYRRLAASNNKAPANCYCLGSDSVDCSLSGNLAVEVCEVPNSFGGEDYAYMKCQVCEELDSHLQDFIDGEIDDISRQRLSQHLNICAEFRAKMEQYQFLGIASCAISDSTALNDGIRARLRDRLSSELGIKIKL